MKFIMRNFHRSYKKIVFFSLIFFVIWFFVFKDAHENKISKLKRAMVFNREEALHEVSVPKRTSRYPVATNYDRKDWHDWDFIAYEKSRVGPGEQGEAVYFTDPEDIKENKRLYDIEGLNALVSDRISVNRSVPDTRHQE